MTEARTSVPSAATPPTMAMPMYPSEGHADKFRTRVRRALNCIDVPLVTRVSMSPARLCAWRFVGSLSSSRAASCIRWNEHGWKGSERRKLDGKDITQTWRWNAERTGRTVKPPSLVVVAHLVVPERKVVQAFPPPSRLGAVYFCTRTECQFRFRAGAKDREPSEGRGQGGVYVELKLVHTLEEADALDLVFPQRALDEAPRIVELGLDGDMGL